MGSPQPSGNQSPARAVVRASARGMILLGCALFVLLVLAAPAAVALDKRQFGQQETAGGMEITPSRIDLSQDSDRPVIPGEPLVFPLSITNFNDYPIKVSLDTFDLEAAADPDQLVNRVEEAQFGAGSWLTPEIDSIRVEPLQQVTLDVEMLAPLDAPVGSNYGAIQVIGDPLGPDAPAAGTGLGFRGGAVAQVYIDIPGDIVRDGDITKASVSDRLFFSEGFQSDGFARLEATYENRGNVTEYVTGEIVIRSMFGNVVRRFPVERTVVLRENVRNTRVLWTDPPKFGRFTATLELDTEKGGFTRTRDFPTITILPPWWWLVILAVAVGVPMFLWWRNRQLDWEQYLDEELDEDELGGYV